MNVLLVPVAECDLQKCEDRLKADLCRVTPVCFGLDNKSPDHGSSSGQSQAGFRERGEFVLPAFLSTSVWKRHKYSLQDIELTLDQFPANHLWSLAVSEGLVAKHKRLGLSVSSCRDKLLSHFGSQDWLQRESVLRASSHVPSLPQHLVSAEFWFTVQTAKHTCLFLWQHTDCYFVPLLQESARDILMVRVCGAESFRLLYPLLRERPPLITVGNQTFAILEEAFVLQRE